ncbi:MAG TPA: hypothetical protein PLV45_14210 [bacterium]|nr:hypothetical protein [bacterium]
MVIAILMGGISKLPVLSQDIELSSSEGFGRMIVSNCTGCSGDFVDVDLHIENPNTPVTAVAMNMIYEPQALQYIEMFPGPGIREWLVLDAIESDPGTLAIAGLAKSDQVFTAGSDGLLLTCRFRVVCAGCSPGCVYPMRVANFQADVS